MTSDSKVIVKSNRMPEVKTKMVVGGKALVKQVLDATAQEIESSGPYRGQLTAKVKWVGGIGTVEVGPWWIGFIELGSVTHSARPFAGPAARRVMNSFVPKLKALGDAL